MVNQEKSVGQTDQGYFGLYKWIVLQETDTYDVYVFHTWRNEKYQLPFPAGA